MKWSDTFSIYVGLISQAEQIVGLPRKLRKCICIFSRLPKVGTSVFNKIHISNSSSPMCSTLQLLLMATPLAVFEAEENEATQHFYQQPVIFRLTASSTAEPLNLFWQIPT